MSEHAKMRKKLLKKYPDQIKKQLAVIRCEKCGRYFSMDNINCHHSIIPIKDLIEACENNKLSIKDAMKFAKDRENIIVLCKECHGEIHLKEKIQKCVQQQ